MNILITGATGFVGIHLLRRIDFKLHQVAVVLRNRAQAEEILKPYLSKLRLIEVNAANYKEQLQQFNPDVVIHLASYLTSKTDTESLLQLVESNILFASILLDALTGTQAKYFINTGSFSEYLNGAPQLDGAYLYSATKIAYRAILDFYSKLNHFVVLNVIPYTIYGGESKQKKVIDLIIDSLYNPIPIKMSEGKQILDFIHIDDVVDYYISLINHIELFVKPYTELYLGSGVGTSIRSLAEAIEEISGEKVNIDWGAVPYRPRDIMYAVAPLSPAPFKWKPQISLEAGLKKIMTARKP